MTQAKRLTTVRFYRGLREQLPASCEKGRVLVTTDTREIFVGQGSDKTVRKIDDIQEVAKMMSDGVLV